ncbi:15572_t:CDS:2 [Dentiscutata heterogama]|uniref:15572_t:CDS:1 n=1 Tax=Dentiscutata heterogama TaxID=1316150 RepID=A0ACA9LCT6_9GLOM|nr:15572_t:CDS:2 [Dentiscutata heterogama]
MSSSDKELARLIETGDIAEKFLTIVSNVVNIIEVIIVLYKSTEYNEHISSAIIRRITEVITVIRSLKRCNDEYKNWKSNEEILKKFDESDIKMKTSINEYALLKVDPEANDKITSLNNKNFGKVTIASINENIVTIHNDIIAIERGSTFKEFISVIAFNDTDVIM